MIKNLLLIIYLITIATFGKAQQSYEPIVDTNKKWNVFFDLSSQGANSYTVAVQFASDTIIDSLSYKKVLRTTDSLLVNWETIGFIREDTALKQVYLMNNSYVEGLLYDFSSKVNDTVYIFNPIHCSFPIWMIVDSIDSIFFAGKYRKRIFYKTSDLYLVWGKTVIEGVGGLNGVVMFGRCLSGGGYKLLCYYYCDSILYINPVYNSCNVFHIINEIKETENPKIKIFPNPIYENFTLEMDDFQNSTLEIFNIHGQCYKKDNIVKRKTNIDISHFSKGIFVLKIRKDNNIIIIKIINK